MANARTSSIRCSTEQNICRTRYRALISEITTIRRRSSFTTVCCGRPDFARQRELMRDFEKLVLDIEAHETFLLWRYRIVPYRSYVKGWKVSPSHYVNQDLATIWLDK